MPPSTPKTPDGAACRRSRAGRLRRTDVARVVRVEEPSEPRSDAPLGPYTATAGVASSRRGRVRPRSSAHPSPASLRAHQLQHSGVFPVAGIVAPVLDRNQAVQIDQTGLRSTIATFLAARPGVVELDAAGFLQQIDAVGCDAELEDLAGIVGMKERGTVERGESLVRAGLVGRAPVVAVDLRSGTRAGEVRDHENGMDSSFRSLLFVSSVRLGSTGPTRGTQEDGGAVVKRGEHCAADPAVRAILEQRSRPGAGGHALSRSDRSRVESAEQAVTRGVAHQLGDVVDAELVHDP